MNTPAKVVIGLVAASVGLWGISSTLTEETPVESVPIATQQVRTDTSSDTRRSEPDTARRPASIETDSNYSVTRPSSSGDRDCGDFSTHAQAQAFFKNAGPGDPHGLDRDGDGDACETLP